MRWPLYIDYRRCGGLRRCPLTLGLVFLFVCYALIAVENQMTLLVIVTTCVNLTLAIVLVAIVFITFFKWDLLDFLINAG